MLQNLHTHTTFCDGKDTPEEMVLAAIDKGFDSLGFSTHAATELYMESELRDFDGYKSTVLSLKEKYKDRIDILFGCELDFYSPGYMPELGYEYKISSVHMSKKGDKFIIYDHTYELAKKQIEEDFCGDSLAYARLYFDTVAEIPNVIPGDFVGHFDLVTKYSEKHPQLIDTESKKYRSHALESLHAVCEKMEFFEVNTGAISRGYRKTPYPAPFILDEMKRIGCKIVLTSDCHNKNYLDCGFAEAKELIKAHGISEIYYMKNGIFKGEKI